MRKLFLLLVFLPLLSLSQNQITQQQIDELLAVEQDSLIQSARDQMERMKLSGALKALKAAEANDSLNAEMLYLKAEIYLMYGMKEFDIYLNKLKQIKSSEYSDVLWIKHLQFIGSAEFVPELEQTLSLYPGHPELLYCKWLQALKQGDFERCKEQVAEISQPMVMKFLPYLAMYYHAWDRDHRTALHYLDTLEGMIGEFYGSKYRPVLNLLSDHTITPSNQALIELPFSWCGPGIGYYLIDAKGDSLKIELDTGTGYGLMTVHDLTRGHELAGEDLLTVENGIQYNYMESRRDLHYKVIKLKKPDYHQLIFGYFDGKFSKADGCASPFIFSGHALHIDPIRERVWLRDENNMNDYLDEHQGQFDIIPYEVRNGWLYIPCKVNGKEVSMMIETGSRDINLNPLSFEYLGVKPYSGSLQWNGKDYPVQKVDFKIQIGSINYEVKGGLVSDFVLGNWYYGLGSAGDIGPDFLRHHAFIIDPFHQQFIILR